MHLLFRQEEKENYRFIEPRSKRQAYVVPGAVVEVLEFVQDGSVAGRLAHQGHLRVSQARHGELQAGRRFARGPKTELEDCVLIHQQALAHVDGSLVAQGDLDLLAVPGALDEGLAAGKGKACQFPIVGKTAFSALTVHGGDHEAANVGDPGISRRWRRLGPENVSCHRGHLLIARLEADAVWSHMKA